MIQPPSSARPGRRTAMCTSRLMFCSPDSSRKSDPATSGKQADAFDRVRDVPRRGPRPEVRIDGPELREQQRDGRRGPSRRAALRHAVQARRTCRPVRTTTAAAGSGARARRSRSRCRTTTPSAIPSHAAMRSSCRRLVNVPSRNGGSRDGSGTPLGRSRPIMTPSLRWPRVRSRDLANRRGEPSERCLVRDGERIGERVDVAQQRQRRHAHAERAQTQELCASGVRCARRRPA